MAAGSICGGRNGGGGAVDIWWGGGGKKCKIESLQILDHWRLASLKKRLSAVNSPG